MGLVSLSFPLLADPNVHPEARLVCQIPLKAKHHLQIIKHGLFLFAAVFSELEGRAHGKAHLLPLALRPLPGWAPLAPWVCGSTRPASTSQHHAANPESSQNHPKFPAPAAPLPQPAPNSPSRAPARGTGFARRSLR